MGMGGSVFTDGMLEDQDIMQSEVENSTSFPSVDSSRSKAESSGKSNMKRKHFHGVNMQNMITSDEFDMDDGLEKKERRGSRSVLLRKYRVRPILLLFGGGNPDKRTSIGVNQRELRLVGSENGKYCLFLCKSDEIITVFEIRNSSKFIRNHSVGEDSFVHMVDTKKKKWAVDFIDSRLAKDFMLSVATARYCVSKESVFQNINSTSDFKLVEDGSYVEVRYNEYKLKKKGLFYEVLNPPVKLNGQVSFFIGDDSEFVDSVESDLHWSSRGMCKESNRYAIIGADGKVTLYEIQCVFIKYESEMEEEITTPCTPNPNSPDVPPKPPKRKKPPPLPENKPDISSISPESKPSAKRTPPERPKRPPRRKKPKVVIEHDHLQLTPIDQEELAKKTSTVEETEVISGISPKRFVVKLDEPIRGLDNQKGGCFKNATLQVLHLLPFFNVNPDKVEAKSETVNALRTFFRGRCKTLDELDKKLKIVTTLHWDNCKNFLKKIYESMEDDVSSNDSFSFDLNVWRPKCEGCDFEGFDEIRIGQNYYELYCMTKSISEELSKQSIISKCGNCKSQDISTTYELATFPSYLIVVHGIYAEFFTSEVARVSDSLYELVGLVLVGGVHAISAVKMKGRWNICNDDVIWEGYTFEEIKGILEKEWKVEISIFKKR